MAKASDNQFPKITMLESAAPSTPSSGLGFLYEKTDGKPYFKNDGGTEYDMSGTTAAALTQAYVGYNTVGGSTEVFVTKKVLMKKVTLANDCLITDIEAYVDTTTDKVDNFMAILFKDNAGSPKEILAFNGNINASSVLLPTHQVGAGAARWMGQAIGYWAVAGDYWIAVSIGTDTDIGMRIYYDGSGSDRTYVAGGSWITDAGYTTVTTGTNKYSIRANTIR